MSELEIPRDKRFDSTLALLADGYRFIGQGCQELRTKAFRTRLIFQDAICMQGREASEFFYQPDRFTRKGAMPLMSLKLLQDIGSVQTLDGAEHRARKAMLMSILNPEKVQNLCDAFRSDWLRQLEKWQGKEETVLLHEVQGILTRAVCAWAGIKLREVEARLRTQEFNAMISGAGSVGLRNVWGQVLRSLSENWAEGLIRGVRSGKRKAPEGSALATIAQYRDLSGQLLSESTAAVELINILRPTVAVAWYVMFAAAALEQHPEVKSRIEAEGSNGPYLEAFVHEVRRFYPFFPAIGGRALSNLEWQGKRIKKGSWVLLDIYGTLHDPEIWEHPLEFRPERFLNWEGNPYTLLPQGGGDVMQGHRCAGEGLTIALLKTATALLTQSMQYEVPAQDLSIDYSRMPAVIRSRFLMKNVRPVVSVPIAPEEAPISEERIAAEAFPDFDRPPSAPPREPAMPPPPPSPSPSPSPSASPSASPRPMPDVGINL